MLTESPIFTSHDPAHHQRLARMLKALAQPTRLALLDILGQGERCVCELASLVGAERSNVSRHLAVLLRAGVVSTRRQGVQIFYSLRVPCLLETIRCMASEQGNLSAPAGGCASVAESGGRS